jgi:RimJ/RimL family protein N-acetyltransferase
MTASLRSNRLILRQWVLDDADFAFDMYSRWEVQRFLGRAPRVMEQRSEAVEKILQWQRLDHPVHGVWAVASKGTSQLLGTLLLKPIPASGDQVPLLPSEDVEIGWHFHPDSWGHGYATEAAATVLDHAFRNSLDNIVAVTSPENAASQNVCRRVGMTHHGLTAAYYNTVCELFVASNHAK